MRLRAQDLAHRCVAQRKQFAYAAGVIKSFKNKALAEPWAKRTGATIDRRLHSRIFARLDALDQAGAADELNLPGFDFHALRGFEPARYTMRINGPGCITFDFTDGDAYRVDIEQHH
jgi:proteic killer suppression protein